MTTATATNNQPRVGLRKWIRRVFLIWASLSTLWLANSFRTRGVANDVLQSSPAVCVVDDAIMLQFIPMSLKSKAALIFICGSGVSARAYAPMLRPIAEA